MALVSFSVGLMGDTPHYPWRGCQCQRGGERNGHCHCPDHLQMANTYCRYGGNHWICFPFWGQSWSWSWRNILHSLFLIHAYYLSFKKFYFINMGWENKYSWFMWILWLAYFIVTSKAWSQWFDRLSTFQWSLTHNLGCSVFMCSTCHRLHSHCSVHGIGYTGSGVPSMRRGVFTVYSVSLSKIDRTVD